MELKHQVTSLEIAKQLKSLGAKQESLFHWLDRETANGRKGETALILYGQMDGSPHRYSAFTVAELGELLPKFVGTNRIGTSWAKSNGWAVFYEQNSKSYISHIITARSEADSRGLMLIHLLHHGLQDK